MDERSIKILSILNQKRKITVSELSELLGVSEVTMRKDLSQLEKSGLIDREHGYAMLPKTDDISNRLSFNYEVKKRIAQKAAESVRDGETIMIESGSCCALLAEEIVINKRDVTIITNSAFIAAFVRNKIGSRIILLGGEYQNEAQVMVGPLVKICAENFHVEKLFAGTDGFDSRGAMSGDLMRAEAVRTMAESARNVIILTESKKFAQTGVVLLLPFERISEIYTDDQIDKETTQNLESKGIQIHEAVG